MLGGDFRVEEPSRGVEVVAGREDLAGEAIQLVSQEHFNFRVSRSGNEGTEDAPLQQLTISKDAPWRLYPPSSSCAFQA